MTQPLPSALDYLLNKQLMVGGVPVTPRLFLNLIGATYADNPNNPNGPSSDFTVTGNGRTLNSEEITSNGILGDENDMPWVMGPYAIQLPVPADRFAVQICPYVLFDGSGSAATAPWGVYPNGSEKINLVTIYNVGNQFQMNSNAGLMFIGTNGIDWWALRLALS